MQAGETPSNELAKVQTPPPDAAEIRNQALLALEAGEDETAFALGRQAMRLAPDDPQVVFLNAMILGKRNRFPEAIRMLDQLAVTTPEVRLPALGQTADWLVRYGQWSEAERRYRALLEQFPESALVHRNLAQLMLRQGRSSEAAPHLDQLCRLGDVTEEELRSLLNLLHPFAGDRASPTMDPIGALGKARNEISQGNWEQAREELEASDSIGAAEIALLGRVEAKLGDFEALTQWKTSTSDSIDPYADGWVARGSLSARQGNHANAVRSFAEAVLRDQTDHQAYSLMGESLKAIGASDEAEGVMSRAAMIRQTQESGAKMAASSEPDETEITKLIDLLDQLQRPLEALAWRGMRLAYARSEGSISDAEAQQTLEKIMSDRSQLLNANLAKAPRPFVLCGIDLEKWAPAD